AASAPEEGINALDSVLQLFNGIHALREHLPRDVKIHGIISEGGKAANIVPDYAVAQFYIRANERTDLNKIVDKVTRIAEGAALMTGATLSRSEEHTSELQSRFDLVCRLLLEKKKEEVNKYVDDDNRQ